MAALRGGDRPGARVLLLEAARVTPADPQVWLWLAGALDDSEKQRYCLARALSLDPGLAAARHGLAELEQSEVRSQKSADLPLPDPAPVEGSGADRSSQPSGHLPHHVALSPPSPARGRGGQGVRANSPPKSHKSPQSSGALFASHPLTLPPHPPAPSPLLLIWTQPRPALRAAIAGRSLLETGVLAGLCGVAVLLAWADLGNLGDRLRPAELGLLALIGGLPLGYALCLIGGVLLRSGGRWLGGVAGAGAVRAALAWAALPSSAGLLLWIMQLTLLPAASFGGGPASPAQSLAAMICSLTHLALALWSCGLSLVGLSVAHRISIARAAASWLLAALIVVGAAAGIFAGAALLITLRGG